MKQAEGADSLQFTFLTCSERSGSNLITSLMNGHPAVSGPPPSHLFRLFGMNEDRYGPLADDRNWRNFSTDFQDGFAAMLGSWNYKPEWDKIFSADAPRSVAHALSSIYRLEADTDRADQSFVKENHTPAFWDFLDRNWPDCRIVYQVRDPRDVAASWLHTPGIRGGVETAIDTWVSDQHAALELRERLNAPERVLRVRYEDLLADTETCARALCNHIGVPFEPSMLAFNADDRTQRNAARIDAWSNLSRPVLANNAGGFARKLSVLDVRYVELRCYELMANFGYETVSMNLPLSPEARLAEAESLGVRLTASKPYALSTGKEEEIRLRRLALIKRVIEREPHSATLSRDRA